ncbi:MAG: thioredoxin family protein [Bacteroidota bacterium]
MFRKPLIVSALFSISIGAFGQGLKIGDKAPDFTLKSTEGKEINLSGIQDNKGAIVVFTCNHCPFSVAYEDRIIALHNKFKSLGYPVIAINPNDSKRVPEESFKHMKKRAKEKSFPFVYLQDESQEIAKAYGASRTPHVFIVQKETDGSYVLRYIGAIDNNTDDPAAADKKYVDNAVNELLLGNTVSLSSTKAIGCSIKWKKP